MRAAEEHDSRYQSQNSEQKVSNRQSQIITAQKTGIGYDEPFGTSEANDRIIVRHYHRIITRR